MIIQQPIFISYNWLIYHITSSNTDNALHAEDHRPHRYVETGAS